MQSKDHAPNRESTPKPRFLMHVHECLCDSDIVGCRILAIHPSRETGSTRWFLTAPDTPRAKTNGYLTQIPVIWAIQYCKEPNGH